MTPVSTSAPGGQGTSPTRIDSPFEAATYRKVTWRLLPFLIACYLVAYLDRVNIGFARLQMMADLGFSETVYGLGAGIFFIGYFFFEVPSNIALHKFGARAWIARIMITWGVISALFMFVRTPFWFYTLRFLLGVAEAGFYPGIILYLTYWYPAYRRARMTSLFMTAIPVSGVFGGPISGWIMQTFHDQGGWAGWQWLFLLEALPSVVLGFVVFFYLDNGIREAKWLNEDEKQLLEREVAAEAAVTHEHPSVWAVFADKRIWHMCIIYFACSMGSYGLTFWMPVLIQAAGVKGVFNIGLLTAIPYSAAIVGMMLLGASADRRRERRWHVALTLLLGAVSLVGSVLVGEHVTLAIAFLSLAAVGILSAPPIFWSLPTAFLRGTAAAAGIATINSVANLGGFVSPYVVGALRDYTHSTEAGMWAVAFVLVVGAIAALMVPAKLVNR